MRHHIELIASARSHCSAIAACTHKVGDFNEGSGQNLGLHYACMFKESLYSYALTLYLIETPFNTYANREDPDQAAKAA